MLFLVLFISISGHASSPSEVSHSDDVQGLWTNTYRGCLNKYPGQEARCTELANSKHPIQPIGPDKPLKDAGFNDGPGRPGGPMERPVDGSPADLGSPLPAEMGPSERNRNSGNRGRARSNRPEPSQRGSGEKKGSSSSVSE